MKNVFLIHSVNGNTIDSFAGSIERFCKENNIEYYYPIFPLRAEASPESWEKVLDEYRIKRLLNSESLVITHSIGTKFIPKYLAKYNINIDTFVSVAGFVDYVGRTDYLKDVTEIFEITDEEFSKCKELIKNRFAIYSDNDNNSSIEKCIKYADKLSANKILVEGAGHFTKKNGVTEIETLNAIMHNYLESNKV